MTNVGAKAQGRRVHHDPRSRDYAAPRKAVTKTSWLHDMGPVLDQGQVNGCTGWSGADWLNTPAAIGNRRKWNLKKLSAANPTLTRQGGTNTYLGNADGRTIYAQATQFDPFPWTYPPTDQGSSGLGVAKALKKLGVIDSYTWAFTFDQFLAASQAQVVLVGTLWTDAMMEPDAKGVIRTGGDGAIRKAASDGEGHEYTVRGINLRTGYARIRNHWTAGWGIKGEALISLTELETLIIANKGDVLVPTLAAK